MKTLQLRVFVLLALVWVAPVNAALINQSVLLNVTSGFPLDQITVNPFDTGLGTLDEVRVGLDGTLVHSGLVLGLNPYTITTELNLFGLGGQFFRFSNPAVRFIQTGLATYQTCGIGCVPAYGPLVSPPSTLNFDFSFNRQLQELTGLNQGFIDGLSSSGSGVSPPIVILGAIDDFHESLVPLNQMNLLLTTSDNNPIITGLNSVFVGNLSITYDFTPHPIPVPPAIWLFGTALIGFFKFSRNRKLAG